MTQASGSNKNPPPHILIQRPNTASHTHPPSVTEHSWQICLHFADSVLMERLDTAIGVMGNHALVAARLMAHLSDGRLEELFEGHLVIMVEGPTV